MRKVIQQFQLSTLRSTVEALQDDGWEPEGQMIETDAGGEGKMYSMYMAKPESMASDVLCGLISKDVVARYRDHDQEDDKCGKGITIHHEEDMRLFRSIVKKVHDRFASAGGGETHFFDPHETKFIWGLQHSLSKL